jgi:hypothetical protein
VLDIYERVFAELGGSSTRSWADGSYSSAEARNSPPATSGVDGDLQVLPHARALTDRHRRTAASSSGARTTI